MPLSAGSKLGVYEIRAAIGAGGMGEVYRARDTKLNRDVALKILLPVVAADPDQVARLEREAQVLASLNHPNIAHVYGFEDAGGVRALIMELVEGPTLEQKLGQERREGREGPADVASAFSRTVLPLGEAVAIARQIADGLEAAHELGIVHRDLKPANVKVRADGMVKVLDFGLAKATTASPAHASATMSPTLSLHATAAGMILGTAAYMAPEQARGRSVDKRSDIWSFGAVLYEMLAGRRPFEGETISDVLARVIEREPDWQALPASTPPRLRRLLERCLEKDPKSRLRDIGEARIVLQKVADGIPAEATAAAPMAGPAPAWRRRLPWVVAAGLSIALASTLGSWAPWQRPPLQTPLHLGFDVGVDRPPRLDLGAAAVLSPDGATLAYVGVTNNDSQLYVRKLDQLQSTLLAGTTGAHSPFFAPDGGWIGFFALGKLKKVSVTGGASIAVCDAPEARGGAWASDGTIIFQPDRGNGPQGLGLRRVSAAGGTPEPLTAGADGVFSERWPQILPEGRGVLFTRIGTIGSSAFDAADLAVEPLGGGPVTVVQRSAYYGRYVPSGHLVYVHDGTLFAAAFNLSRLEIVGQPVPIVQGLATSTATGGAQFAFSETGRAVYFSGDTTSNNVPIQWLDRSGKPSLIKPPFGDWTGVLFSPDGTRLAMDLSDGSQRDVWTYDLARDAMSRITFDPNDDVNPVWTPNGQRIVFGSKRDAKPFYNLYWQPADGSGEPQRLGTSTTSHQIPGSWHPSGRFLAYHDIPQPNNSDLMILPMEGSDASGWKPGTPSVFLKTPASEQVPEFSPDGNWIAYYSDESGRNEVYVRPFPKSSGKWQISTGGGTYPTWSSKRHELYYASPDNHIMMVQYSVEGGSFRSTKPETWADVTFTFGQYRRFTLHPDGERFAIGKRVDAAPGKAVFIVNFFDELRRLVPAK